MSEFVEWYGSLVMRVVGERKVNFGYCLWGRSDGESGLVFRFGYLRLFRCFLFLDRMCLGIRVLDEGIGIGWRFDDIL